MLCAAAMQRLGPRLTCHVLLLLRVHQCCMTSLSRPGTIGWGRVLACRSMANDSIRRGTLQVCMRTTYLRCQATHGAQGMARLVRISNLKKPAQSIMAAKLSQLPGLHSCDMQHPPNFDQHGFHADWAPCGFTHPCLHRMGASLCHAQLRQLCCCTRLQRLQRPGLSDLQRGFL